MSERKSTGKRAAERYLKKIELLRQSNNVNIYETPLERSEAIRLAKKHPGYCVLRYFKHYATAECADFQIEFAEMVKKDPTFTGFAKWGRGLAKSVWCDIIIPFWLWLNEGDNYIVIVGVNEKRACQLLEDLRAEFEANPQIIADFGEMKNLGSWDEALWMTKDKSFIGQALGFGQECRGLRVGSRRPKYYSCDDLETRKTIKNDKSQDAMVEWVENDLLPSMDGENERLIFPNNWWADTMFLKKLHEKHPDWKVHEVKAYDPVTYEPRWKAKYKPDYYRNKEKKMGILAAHAEYNHDAKPKGKIFKPEHIQWGKMPRLNHFKIIVGHWDIAYAGNEDSDYNAVRVWGLYGTDFWYIDSFVKQSKMRAALLWMSNFQKMLPPTVSVHWRFESQFWNGEVKRTIKEVEEETGVKLNLVKVDTPRTKKYDRLVKEEVYYQNGRCYYNEEKISHADTQVGLKQLYGIEPNYTGHDDAPDADEQCRVFLEKHIKIGGSNNKILVGKMQPKNEAI